MTNWNLSLVNRLQFCMAFGYEGKKVRLVPLDKTKHFENCLKWLNDPEVTQFLLAGSYPITRIQEEDWFESMSRSKDSVIFAIETLDSHTHIGNSGLHHIDLLNGTATSGSFIGVPELWGRGFGSDAAYTRTEYAFDVLGLRLLMTAYLEGNERSKRMSEALGFKEYGYIPNRFWKNGKYVGEHLLMLERNDFIRRS